MKYAIRIEETIGRTIIVEAENLDDAIEKVENAANNDDILLDRIEDFVEREVKPSDVFEGGIVPDGSDVSSYDHLTDNIISTTFISYWDGGKAIKTSCKVNLNTKEVFDIQKVDIDDLGDLEGKQIEIGDYLYDVYCETVAEDGDYWYK